MIMFTAPMPRVQRGRGTAGLLWIVCLGPFAVLVGWFIGVMTDNSINSGGAYLNWKVPPPAEVVSVPATSSAVPTTTAARKVGERSAARRPSGGGVSRTPATTPPPTETVVVTVTVTPATTTEVENSGPFVERDPGEAEQGQEEASVQGSTEGSEELADSSSQSE